MKLIKHFNIPSVLILAISMLALKGALDADAGVFKALNNWQFLLLVLGASLIAGAGFFINNLFGYGKEADPEVSEAKGYNIYIGLNLVGVAIGYYLGYTVEKPMLFTALMAGAAATMYIYATGLKQMILVSNFVVALLVALPVIAVALFLLLPVLPVVPEEMKPTMSLLFRIYIEFGILAFTIGLITSLVNDLANSDEDYNNGTQTLPILVGRGRAAKVVAGLIILPVAMVIYYINENLLNFVYALAYLLVFVVGPLILVVIKLLDAKTGKDFARLESILKLTLLFTAFALFIVILNVQYAK